MPSTTTIQNALIIDRDQLVDEAFASLAALDLEHYGHAGDEVTRQRLDDLYGLVLTAIDDRDVSAVVDYATTVAHERFTAGFDVAEVQLAFNMLETAMWHHVVSSVPADELAASIALLSTVFGIAKDALAREYVSLAASRHVTSLDVSALLHGVAAS